MLYVCFSGARLDFLTFAFYRPNQAAKWRMKVLMCVPAAAVVFHSYRRDEHLQIQLTNTSQTVTGFRWCDHAWLVTMLTGLLQAGCCLDKQSERC